MTVTTSTPPTRAHIGATEVIVPVDLSHESWRALPFARAIAQRLSIPLTPLHIDTTSTWANARSDNPLNLRASVEGDAVPVVVVSGTDAVQTIESTSRERAGSVIVMATHGHYALTGLLVGSVCGELLRVHDGPLFAIGPKFDRARHSEITRIAVYVDATAPNGAITGDALDWADALGVPMVIVSVTGRGRSRPGEDETYQVLDAIFEELPASRVPVTAEVLDHRDPARAILEYANRRPGTLVALAPGAGHRAVHALTHSVSMQVVRESPGPMLLRWARPEPPVAPESTAEATSTSA
jgi:nucleotide-binding universal stress UspA family protein